MTPSHHPGGDDAATLHALADAMDKRAIAHWRDLMQHVNADEWDEAEAALRAMRAAQRAAADLADEAEQA
jgi:hypothetical protein